MEQKYINEIIKESLKSLKTKDVPIGAIVVYDNKIIGRGHNNRLNTNDVTNHAEIIAIKKASKKTGDWRLNECDLYVTLKPCSMCMEVIKQSRIINVYYLLDKLDYKKEYNNTHVCNIKDDDNKNKYNRILSDFFKENTNRK